MTAETPITITPADLERIVERACTAAVELAFLRQASATGADRGLSLLFNCCVTAPDTVH